MFNNVYHVYNKLIEGSSIFTNAEIAVAFLETIRYYRSDKSPLSFSHYKKIKKDIETKKDFDKIINDPSFFRVQILAFCIMPTHFHFLIQEEAEYGLSTYMNDTLNSFTRYYNIRVGRKGPLFLPRFKRKLVRTEAVLLHMVRYIHLNPYSSRIVSTLPEIESYLFSSHQEYLNSTGENICNVDLILNLFNNNKSEYERFILDRADYQKSLELLKY